MAVATLEKIPLGEICSDLTNHSLTFRYTGFYKYRLLYRQLRESPVNMEMNNVLSCDTF